ncbi:unnamed protein product [Arabidopsis halleri]
MRIFSINVCQSTATPQVKLLTRVEQLKLLTKAEKAGLLSLAEKSGFFLSTIERLGLLTKAEEFGVLSAATNPETPGTLFTLSLGLLLLGPGFAYVVPEDYTWEVVVQVLVALLLFLPLVLSPICRNLISPLGFFGIKFIYPV